MPVTAPAKLTEVEVVTVPPRVTAPPVELKVSTDAAETAAPKPMAPVDVTESALNAVAPTMPVMLTAPAPELMVRFCVPDTAPVIVTAPPVVVNPVAAERVVAPVMEISPAVVLIVEPMPTAVAAKVTPEVPATAPLAVIAPATVRVSTLEPTLKLEAAAGLVDNKSTAPELATVSDPVLPKMEIPENNPAPAVLFAAV